VARYGAASLYVIGYIDTGAASAAWQAPAAAPREEQEWIRWNSIRGCGIRPGF
jgi:hypothetical protein